MTTAAVRTKRLEHVFNRPIQSTFTKTQVDSFSSIDRRAKAMLPNESQPASIHNYLKREFVNMVKKCLNKEFASDILDNYFEMIDHSMNASNNKHCVRLPPVKLEVARHGFYFTGSTLCNSLPIPSQHFNVESTLWINLEITLIRRWKWNQIWRRIFNIAQLWYNVSARR